VIACRAFALAALFVSSSVLAVTAATAQEATPTASPANAVRATTICALTFPAEFVPTGPARVVFWREIDDPGVVQDSPAGSTPKSIVAVCVTQGEWAMKADSEAVLIPGGSGSKEMIPRGKQAQVSAGDAIIVLDNEAPGTITNSGPGQVELFGFGIVSTAPPPCVAADNCPTMTPGVQVPSSASLNEDDWERAGLAGVDVAVTIRRVEMSPGASITSEEVSPTLRFIETGTVQWSVQRPDVATPLSPITFGPLQPTIWWTPLQPGSTLTLHNGEAEPAIFYELVLTAAGPESGTPSAGTPSAATPVS
jgi:hypothetical protein